MVKYWLQTHKIENWNTLKYNLSKGILNIYSHNFIDIAPNDIFILYFNNKEKPTENGFGCYGKIKSKFEINENKNKRVFIDLGLSKYVCPLKEVNIFDKECKMNIVKDIILDICNVKNVESFRKKYTQKIGTLLELPEELGKSMIQQFEKIKSKLIESHKYDSDMSDDDNHLKSNINNKFESKSETESESETETESESESETKSETKSETETETESESETDSKSNSDSKSVQESQNKNIIGNIPIGFIPCKKFKLTKNKKENYNEFKNHYKTCENCDKTNNNKLDIIELFNTHKIIWNELEDEDDIENYLDYLHNEKKYNYKIDKSISIYKINNENHDYHDSFIILF
jgi:hypothetical protein